MSPRRTSRTSTKPEEVGRRSTSIAGSAGGHLRHLVANGRLGKYEPTSRYSIRVRLPGSGEPLDRSEVMPWLYLAAAILAQACATPSLRTAAYGRNTRYGAVISGMSSGIELITGDALLIELGARTEAGAGSRPGVRHEKPRAGRGPTNGERRRDWTHLSGLLKETLQTIFGGTHTLPWAAVRGSPDPGRAAGQRERPGHPSRPSTPRRGTAPALHPREPRPLPRVHRIRALRLHRQRRWAR
jgi:hypothetical protein